MPAANMPPRDGEMLRTPMARMPERQPERTRAATACECGFGWVDMGFIR